MAKQLLGIGTKVKFLTTPDSGTIVDKLSDGMVMVQLDNVDMKIPAFEEDLVRAEAISTEQNSFFTALKPIHTLKKEKVNSFVQAKIETFDPLSIKSVFKNSGVHLAFLPMKKQSGEIEKFDILLVNDTVFELIFGIDLVLFDSVKWKKDGLLKSTRFERLGEVAFDDINDSPQIDVSIKPIYTEGVGEEQIKTVKIKAKQFVKNLQYISCINIDAHLFTAFEQVGNVQNAGDDLKNYTKQASKTVQLKKQNDNFIRHDTTPSPTEYAAFVPEIDLHIEMLHNNPTSVPADEIIRYQLRAFEFFLEKAIRLNVPKVYAIHGVGKGKLRDSIAARLRRHTDVLMFKNQYHERYGWGATEIWLK
ncbi:MAG: Smr/MutS family protein [Saprospiraceae bacterium]|nr:Smr/MutS family protein [Saprospiraceae bacterium]